MVRLSFQIIKNTEIPSIILSCDNQRYIFNVPETFQRIYREHRMKMTQGPIFFFTRSSTESVSGIIGMMLTLFQEQFSFNTKMYGPSKVGELLQIIRFNEVGGFKTLPFSYYDLEISKTTLLGMRQLKTVDEILLRSNNCNFQEQLEVIKSINIEKDVDLSNHNDASNLIINDQYEDQYITIKPIILYGDDSQEESKGGSCQRAKSIQYAVVSKIQPGKVLQEKLQKYKIEKSQLSVLFKQGYLQMDNGQIVYEKDVRSSEIDSHLILILDIQSEQQIIQLQQSIAFLSLMEQVENKSIILQAFVHLSASDVVITQKYQEFLQKFSTYHSVLCNFQSEQNNESQLIHSAFITRSIEICKELNLHFPNNFPNIEDKKLKLITFLKGNLNIFGYFPLYEYVILPRSDQPYGPIHNQVFDQISKRLKPNEETSNQKCFLLEQQLFQDDRKLIFLGTGSMKPGKYRNVSSNIITSPRSNILLDCGEGTWNQVLDENIDILNKPLLIWISHIHSDHHLGILNLMFQYIKFSSQPNLYVIIPALMVPWVYHYERLIPSFDRAKFIPIQYFLIGEAASQNLIQDAFISQRNRNDSNLNIDDVILQNLYEQSRQNYNELSQQLNELFQIKTLQPVPVEHCPQAFGIAITMYDDFKISYSGDTRPCKSFSECSKNANIMIHEATFSDELQENAIQNMHSTTREAVELAIESNSKYVALTHFSQRYAKSGVNQKNKGLLSIEINLVIKIQSIPNKYTDDEYFNYLKYNSIYAVDHLGGYLDQLQQLVTVSQTVGKLLPEDE